MRRSEEPYYGEVLLHNLDAVAIFFYHFDHLGNKARCFLETDGDLFLVLLIEHSCFVMNGILVPLGEVCGYTITRGMLVKVLLL